MSESRRQPITALVVLDCEGDEEGDGDGELLERMGRVEEEDGGWAVDADWDEQARGGAGVTMMAGTGKQKRPADIPGRAGRERMLWRWRF